MTDYSRHAPCQLVKLNGRWDLWLPPHRAARAEWTSDAGWERARLDAMHDVVVKDDVVLDVGSEEGEFGALCALWGGKTVCIEPNSAVWPNVRLVYESNNLVPLATFVGFAGMTTDYAGQHMKDVLHMGDNWPACANGPVIGDHGFARLEERPDIARITIDELVQIIETPPNVITIDVEGAEWFVLEGAQHTLRYFRPQVFCSVHPDFMVAHYNQTPALVHNLMEACGYTVRHIATDHEQHFHYVPQ